MMLPPPKVDTRSAEDIVKWVKQQERFNVLQDDQLSEALVRIFARYCEIVIERLNQVPEKNHRVFLNDLGISRNPPIAAQAPLTFTPVKNAVPVPIVIPQHTKVAAAPSNGENSPVTFETNQVLTVTQAELVKIAVIDTYDDCYSDVSYLTSLNHEIDNIFPFKGTLPIRHELYIGVKSTLVANTASNLQLEFSISRQKTIFLDYRLEWRIQSDTEELLVTPEQDTTEGLSRSGIITFNNFPKWRISRKGGCYGYWLVCRLVYSAQPAERKKQNIVKQNFPAVNRIEITGYSYLEETRLDCAFVNNVPIDLSKDFFPLGRIPHFGDVFYINSPGLANLEANVTLNIKLTNPASEEKESPIPRVNQTGRAMIQWEFWNGSNWDILSCNDNTQALTEDGKVSFVIPDMFKETAVNGLKGYWIRARLIAGHYGLQESIEYINQKGQGQNVRYIASTLAPPSIAAITVSTTKKIGPSEPAAVMTNDDFVISNIDFVKTRTLTPFRINLEPTKALYFVLKATNRDMLAGHGLDLYFKINHAAERIVYSGDQQHPILNWQYWNGTSWAMCKIRYDETQSFNVTGVVSLFIPDDIACWEETDSSLVEGITSQDQFVVDTKQVKLSQIEKKPVTYGIRVVWVTGDYQCKPVLQRVLLNTVLAKQVLTLEDEILGSSNGIPNQIFFSARTPILDNLMLEVKEPHLPSSMEMNKICQEEDENAVTINRTAKNIMDGVWVRWHEVNDFLESGHSDRHFVVERISGEIRFGNGDKGMLPPAGANNIRLRTYKTGGGSQGNKSANSITQLRTALPLIAAVTNHDPAVGGQDIEDWDSVYERGSTHLRHRGRAVTAGDFEDLARISSPLVAKVKCFPLKDLSSDFPVTSKPGVVSLVIVPQKTESEPRPSLDLLRHVWEFINPLRMESTSLVLVGPDYLYINVHAEIAPRYESIEMDVVTVCRERLEAFFHPLTGGENTNGWAFGKQPHESDVYALLESLPCLEFVRSLQVTYQEERTGMLESGNFLVCSGKHKITLCQ